MHETKDRGHAITGTMPKAGLSTSGGSLRTLPVGLRGGVAVGSGRHHDIRTASEGREDGPTEAQRKGVVSIMTKKAATALIYSKTLTFGFLKEKIREKEAKGQLGASKLNPSLTIQQVCEIFAGAFAERNDSDVVEAERYSPTRDRYIMTKDALIARNILVECA